MLSQIRFSRRALYVEIGRKLGGEIPTREVHLSLLTCKLKWPNQASVCSSLNILIYILILYLENQVTNVNSIPNNQCPENESFSNENTILTSGVADLNGPAVDISNSSILIYCKGCKKNCSSDLFHDSIRNKSFKRCNDCRRRDYDRRRPENFQALPNPRPQQSIACECKR